MLDVPAARYELAGQPFQQQRVSRPLALRTKVLGRLDEALPEEVLPIPVHDDPRRERVALVDQPACQGEAVLRRAFRKRRQTAWRFRRAGFFLVRLIPRSANQNERLSRLSKIPHHHRPHNAFVDRAQLAPRRVDLLLRDFRLGRPFLKFVGNEFCLRCVSLRGFDFQSRNQIARQAIGSVQLRSWLCCDCHAEAAQIVKRVRRVVPQLKPQFRARSASDRLVENEHRLPWDSHVRRVVDSPAGIRLAIEGILHRPARLLEACVSRRKLRLTRRIFAARLRIDAEFCQHEVSTVTSSETAIRKLFIRHGFEAQCGHSFHVGLQRDEQSIRVRILSRGQDRDAVVFDRQRLPLLGFQRLRFQGEPVFLFYSGRDLCEKLLLPPGLALLLSRRQLFLKIADLCVELRLPRGLFRRRDRHHRIGVAARVDISSFID